MKQIVKQVVSLVLVLVMLAGMMPMQAFATEGTQETGAVEVVTEVPEEETEPSEEEEESSEPSEPVEEPEGIHEHDYEAVATDPTCTEQGYTTYTCACGDSYVDDYVDALGHTYENGICNGCGSATSPYLQQLPEDITGCSNLYNILTPTKGYYTATKYDTSNGEVLSVVIPVEPGDRIAASSFASKAENMGSVNAIRVTYLLRDKIVSSLSPSDVYNSYTTDGYITVPDGVDAVCVPWWKPSERNWLTLCQINKEFAVHRPTSVSEQAPTCTESGYTEGEICAICNASLGAREEIPPAGHVYSDDICTICGAIDLGSILGGKYVSILGDSISTFKGYSNDATVNTTIGGNGPRYDAGTADTKPGSYCLLESVHQTWWMHFANRSGMKLLVNNSWAGSQVFGGKTSDGRVIPAAYLDRCVNLHDNTLDNNPGNAPVNPDVIFVYLGINDYNFNRSKVGAGVVDYAGLVNSDGVYVTPANFGEAYGIMLHKMQNAYPNAQIFAMTLLPENLYSVDQTAWEQHNAYIRGAAEYYGIPVVDLAENCAITWENYSGYMMDKIHPTTAGMKLISDCIEAEVIAYYKENPTHTHTYKSTVADPACTEQGYTTYTCACGDSYVSDYVNAIGHKRSNGICTVCGDSFAGKKVSILSHSMSTYAGVSNNTSYNSTIGSNDVYYTEGRHGVYQKDTWWQQTIDALDMELLVNNSWSGSCVFQPRKGEASVGYGDRAVNLHNDHTGEEPDVIFVYLGCNDFAYYKDSFGKAGDVDYAAIIQERGDGTFSYATPATACEAYAIMLHKAAHRYPDAEIFCMTSTARRAVDYTGDTYPDAGQPTAYVAELQRVAEYFGYPVVDLENAIAKDVEIFDKYMGDKRAHANALGMDQITRELLSVMLGKEAEICHVTADDGAVAEQAVLLGGSYHAEVNISQGHSVVVTMEGNDITAGAYQDGRIAIAEVTGNIHVKTVINRDPQNFRWAFRNGTLTSVGTSENVLTKLSGTVTNNILNDGIFRLNTSVVLKHDLPWSVEWKCAEDWRGVMLTSHKESATKGMTFLSRVNGGQLCFGTYTGSQYDNYGIDISGLNADTHTYRLENRIAADGSNMIWLHVDGEEIGPMNNYFIGSKNQNKTSNWVSGKDFVFSFIGMTGHALRNCRLEYLAVTECDHTYANGTCTGCGENEPSESMSLRYDDHLDMSGKTVEIIDAGTPTSWQVGYGVEENKVLDTAVVTLKDNALVATGIGAAKVKIDGVLYEVTVEAAPISLLLLIGQSNMQGIDGNAGESIICAAGQVYATYADRYKKTVEDVTKFAPSALSGEHQTINVTGDNACLENYPVNMLTEAGNGREGMDSGIAYEWTKQTGEKVWTVNVGYGGSSIKEWQEGGVHYQACLELFKACQDTLRKEIAAGHFTLSHMAYFWCQGCADENQTAEWYVDQFLTMHDTLKTDMAFDEDTTFEFTGIVPIRSGHNWVSSYRAGVYKDSTNVPYYQSFKDLQFNGPRVAQYWMGNNPELSDIWNVCTIQEGWATLPDGTDGVAEYFESAYKDGIVDYPTQVTKSDSWRKPNTPAAVHDNIHYNQIGYNELGRESARNALVLLGEISAPNATPEVKFLTWDGFTSADKVIASTTGVSGTLVVPMVYPVWKSKDVTYTVSEGLRYAYYDLLAESVRTEGTLTASNDAGTIMVAPRELNSFRWDLDGNEFTNRIDDNWNENAIAKLAGSVTNGVFSGVRYKMDKAVQLLHNEAWCVEIQIENWTATAGSMILSSSPDATQGTPYFYFRPKDCFVGIGCYNGSTYDNYGVSLKKHDIACSEGAHTYQFVNRISDDGTNMIYLIVDNQEIGALTDHYVNSTLVDSGNTWLSGKDFAMPYFGTTTAPISNCTMNCIVVTETKYNPEMHLHDWSGWELVSAPSCDGPGEEKRNCSGCGETQTRAVEGVWQTHGLGEHLVSVPENFCSGINLWKILPHDAEYYHSGEKWAKHESGAVYSITIAVNAGDKIFATSFGKYTENGNTIGTSNGIRVTFFDAEGVLKTMAPPETYAEFAANGGYIVAPEGVVAINIPMYGNRDTHEIFILNRDHCYENGICTGCGATASGELVPVKNRLYLETEGSVWIDGQEYMVQQADGIRYVDIPDETAKVMTTYTYGTIDGETYPIGMKVWILENRDGFYSATHQSAFDDLLRYEGCSIRITGKQGIRMITSIDEGNKNALVGAGLAGYTLKEYGTAIAWARQLSDRKPLVLGKSYVNHNFAYSREAGKDPVFDSRDGRMHYTNVLVGFGLNQCSKEIALRPYMILEDAEGNAITIYGGVVERSIYYIASKIQQKNLYAPESEEYKYLQKIIESSSPAK